MATENQEFTAVSQCAKIINMKFTKYEIKVKTLKQRLIFKRRKEEKLELKLRQ